MKNKIQILTSTSVPAPFSKKAFNSLPGVLEGKVGLYWAGMMIVKMRLVDVHVDDTCLFFTCSPLAMHGLPTYAKPLKLIVTGDKFFATNRCLFWQPAKWRIIIEERVIDGVSEILKCLPKGVTYQHDQTIDPIMNKLRYTPRDDPGPAAKNIYKYLNKQLAEMYSGRNLLLPEEK